MDNFKITAREIIIKDYFRKIDLKSENWSYQSILEDLKSLLGECPAVDIHYKKDVSVNEALNKSTEVTKLDKVSIIFTDPEIKNDKGFDKIRKIELFI